MSDMTARPSSSSSLPPGVAGPDGRAWQGPTARQRPVDLALIGGQLAVWVTGGLLVALVCAALVTLAYQIRSVADIVIGDEVSEGGTVNNFYADEQREYDGTPFRWTRAISWVSLSAWGSGPHRLTIEMAAPINPDPELTLLVNEVEIGRPGLAEYPDTYTYDLPAELIGAGDVTLRFQAKTFSAPNDSRRLGVLVQRVRLEPLASGPVAPALGGLMTSVALALLAYLSLGLAGWTWPRAAMGAAGVALALAGLLAVARLFITPVLGEMVGIGLLALGVTLALRLGLAALGRWGGWRLPTRERRWLLTLVAAVLLVRLAGTLHPQIDIIDLGFHANRYGDVTERGQLVLMVRSAEWGARETIYSPAAYLTMWPLGQVIPDTRRMIQFFTVLMETSRLLLVFALARWATGSGRAGLLAGLLFVTVPIAILPFSWGITSNLYGEWWATALLVTLALGWTRLARPPVAALAVVVATMAFLSHPGVLLLTGGWLAALIAVLALAWLARRQGDRQESGEDTGVAAVTGVRVATLALIVALAGGLAVALFYRVQAADMIAQGAATLSEQVGGAAVEAAEPRRWRVNGGVADPSIGLGSRFVDDPRALPLEGLMSYAREAWAYYRGWPLLAAAAGWWLLGGSERGRHLRRLALAWTLAVAGFALIGLLLNLYVRYMLFWLPVVCVLAAVALDALARRGRAGAALTLLLLAATTGAGFWFWQQRIVFFYH